MFTQFHLAQACMRMHLSCTLARRAPAQLCYRHVCSSDVHYSCCGVCSAIPESCSLHSLLLRSSHLLAMPLGFCFVGVFVGVFLATVFFAGRFEGLFASASCTMHCHTVSQLRLLSLRLVRHSRGHTHRLLMSAASRPHRTRKDMQRQGLANRTSGLRSVATQSCLSCQCAASCWLLRRL